MKKLFNSNEADQSYCRFGAETLRKILKTIEAQTDGVEKSNDIEYVHKMRVTSRRIRAAMPLFKECFPTKCDKEGLNEIKKVTQFLGGARDLDIQILVLKDYIKKLLPTEPKTRIEELLKQQINQRTELQSKVIEGLKELKDSKVLQQMTDYCQQIINQLANTSFNLYAVQEKAFWQISSKLDDFLSMEEYVHDENEKLKHHEMRIRAKWLRYTLETFAPIFENELSEEIKIMKDFQDTLGEMHDCDVWIECIPKFMQENTIVKQNEDLLRFLDNIKEKRKEYYQNFVRLWDEKKRKNRFEEIREKASAGFLAATSRTKAELKNPYVKIGLIADIHANIDALEAILEDAKHRGITVFLNAGDLIGFGAFPNEVIQTLYSNNVLSVIGNFDLEVLDRKNRKKDVKKFALEYPIKTLTKSNETYLRTLPLKLELEIAHKKILVTHGTPDSINEHLYHTTPEKRFQELTKTINTNIMVFGHSHEQFIKETDGTLFINPGSAGRPGDGNPQASYAVIITNPFTIELLKVNYDVEKAADALRKRGAPESYSQMLLRGLSLDSIIAEDKTKDNDMEKRYMLMPQNARRFARKLCPDMKHAEQVRKLSLGLFDTLRDLHNLGEKECRWLECAAILHDVGLSKGQKEHHKNSMKLILNDTQLPLTSTERRIIGNIVRYHRKSCPKIKHYNFMSLSRKKKHEVTKLAGILRLADGLDFSHQSIIQKVEAHTSSNQVTIEGIVRLNPVLEEYAINKKKDMFEKSFKKKVIFTWKQNQTTKQPTVVPRKN